MKPKHRLTKKTDPKSRVDFINNKLIPKNNLTIIKLSKSISEPTEVNYINKIKNSLVYADEVNVIDIQMSILLLLDSTQRTDAKTFNSVLKLLYGSLSNRRDQSILNTSIEINSLPDNIGNLLRLVKSNLDQVLHPVRDILTPQTPLVLVERIVDSFLDGVEKCSTFDPNSSFQEDFAVNQTKMINSFKEKLLPQTIRSAFQSKIVRIDTPHPPVENITGCLENDFSKFIESVYRKTNTTISFTDQAEISFNKYKNENIEELSSIKLLTKLPNLDTNSLIDFRRENRELRSLYWSTIREYAQILRSSENETSAELVADRIEKEYIKKYSEFFSIKKDSVFNSLYNLSLFTSEAMSESFTMHSEIFTPQDDYIQAFSNVFRIMFTFGDNVRKINTARNNIPPEIKYYHKMISL